MHYVDAHAMHGTIPDELVGFVKLDKFTAEREFRYIFHAKERMEDVFVLNVGSLRDISVIVPIEEFRKEFRIELRG